MNRPERLTNLESCKQPWQSNLTADSGAFLAEPTVNSTYYN